VQEDRIVGLLLKDPADPIYSSFQDIFGTHLNYNPLNIDSLGRNDPFSPVSLLSNAENAQPHDDPEQVGDPGSEHYRFRVDSNDIGEKADTDPEDNIVSVPDIALYGSLEKQEKDDQEYDKRL
jgi:hypothetical protein